MAVLEWIICNTPYILLGGYVGWMGARCASMKRDFAFFKETKFSYLQDDVKDLTKDKYSYVRHADLERYHHAHSLRIAILETKLEEREKRSE